MFLSFRKEFKVDIFCCGSVGTWNCIISCLILITWPKIFVQTCSDILSLTCNNDDGWSERSLQQIECSKALSNLWVVSEEYFCKDGVGTADQSSQGEMFMLSEFIYDLDRSNAQTFNAKSAEASIVNMVRLDFASNHGGSHTCIYRLRVHGHEPDTIALPNLEL